ncbi:hypothetical protein JBE27_23210, partial [Streptomyces albiflaviniger]|nr:hypothetical protein [Streptomyces albiflaviniger]
MAHSTSGKPTTDGASEGQDALRHGDSGGGSGTPPPTRRGMLSVAAAAGLGLLAGCGEETAGSSGAGPRGSTKAERSPSATPSEHSPS